MSTVAAEERINILIVDDRPENLISLAALLDDPSFNLVKAHSGKEALWQLLNDDFALILLDVQMPIMDGFETATIIKQRLRSRHIPIIFITAVSADALFLGKGYEAGAVDYILKPIDPKILRSKVAVFADLYRMNQLVRKQAAVLRNQEVMEREREIARLELENLRKEQEANEKYRDLVEGITNGIVWVASPLAQKFLFASPQIDRILGHDMLAPLELQIFSDEHLQRVDWAAPPPSISFEHSITRRDGKIVWLQSSLRLVVSETAPTEIRGLSVDITELKEAQAEAQRAIKVRDEFLSIASHELKTPLTPLSLHLEGMQRLHKKEQSLEIQAKFGQGIAKACKQVERLASLVDELLDISRIRSGKFVLEREHFDLGELAREVVERLVEAAKKSGCALEVRVVGTVEGFWDRNKIEQIIVNLLTNAIKYGAGKPIYLIVDTDGVRARISVRDEGIGISLQDQERIFNLYERAVSPLNFGGLGLGLYIVRQIVSEHAGVIRVESKPGEGSLFVVEMPRMPAAEIGGGVLKSSPALRGTPILREVTGA